MGNTEQSLRDMTLKTTGLLGIALLTLTACSGDDETTASEPNTEETATEPADDDAAAQDTTDNEPAEAEDEATTEETTTSEDPPGFDEIEDDMWTSSVSQDSVSITADVPLNTLGEGAELLEQGPDEETNDEGITQITFSGDMNGDGYSYQLGGSLFDFLAFNDVTFQSTESVVAEYSALQSVGSEAESLGSPPEELQEALDPEGDWVDVTNIVLPVETPREYIENLGTGIISGAGVNGLADLGLQGEADNQDGEDVWVYSQGDGENLFEVTVRADPSEPVLMNITSVGDGQELSFAFTDWNEADTPERPTEDSIISEEVFAQISASMF